MLQLFILFPDPARTGARSPRRLHWAARAARGALVGVVASLVAACDPPAPAPAAARATASVASTAPVIPEKKYELPSPEGFALADVGEEVDRARSRLPSADVGKIDAWLARAVRVPVEVRGETKKTLSDVHELTCGYSKKMQCAFHAKLAKAAKHFVASQLLCVGADDKLIHCADWKFAPDVKRGELVALSVDDTLLRACWEKGGVKLRMEVVGAPCVVPFPRQVRCAGEYSTCLYRCKDSESCEQICEKNRRSCLAVCKP